MEKEVYSVDVWITTLLLPTNLTGVHRQQMTGYYFFMSRGTCSFWLNTPCFNLDCAHTEVTRKRITSILMQHGFIRLIRWSIGVVFLLIVVGVV